MYYNSFLDITKLSGCKNLLKQVYLLILVNTTIINKYGLTIKIYKSERKTNFKMYFILIKQKYTFYSTFMKYIKFIILYCLRYFEIVFTVHNQIQVLIELCGF